MAAAEAVAEKKPAARTDRVIFFSVFKTYAKVLSNDEGEIKSVNGKNRFVRSKSGHTIKFLNHKGTCPRALWEEICAEKDPELSHKTYWYGIEWIEGSDLAKMFKEQPSEYESWINRMRNALARHCSLGKEPSTLTLSRQVEKELKDAGLL